VSKVKLTPPKGGVLNFGTSRYYHKKKALAEAEQALQENKKED
jgi:hypothetical protein